jgi:sugar phosphate isomerase/epimerase
MDNLGSEHIARLIQLSTEAEKWDYVRQVASGFGFAGIQVSPTYYARELGLPVTDIPRWMGESFRFTYHSGGIYHLSTPDDERRADEAVAQSLSVAVSRRAEDVSLHPPVLANVALHAPGMRYDAPDDREESKERLRSVLSKWLPRFQEEEISLSLETHVTSSFFVFEGIEDFREFVLSVPGLGVLVDVSHNHYDDYDIAGLVSFLQPLPITGFHLSDAIRGVALAEGTHLPVGQGEIDFQSLVANFDTDAVYGALEVKGPARGISDSLAHLASMAHVDDGGA